MDEVSNKTLATLLVVAIVISLAGTFFAMRGVSQITNIITGAATNPSGTAKVNISELTSISLTQALVDFGVGYRNASVVDKDTECNITTNETPADDCWINLSAYDPDPFVLENDGNTFVNVTINSSNASTFLNGTLLGGTRRYQFMTNDADEGEFPQGQNGCNVAFESATWVAFEPINGAAGEQLPQLICKNMTPDDASDEIYIDINLSIPAGPTGYKTAVVTFYAEKSQQGQG